MSRRHGRSRHDGTPQPTPDPHPQPESARQTLEKDIQTVQSFVRTLGTDAPVVGAVRRLIQAIREAPSSTQSTPQPLSPESTPLLDKITRVVRAEADRTIKELKASSPLATSRSYADAARSAAKTAPTLEARVPLRASREITIKPSGETAPQRLRSGQDIVRDISKIIGTPNIVLAARRLPSGDVTLSFDSEQSRSTWEDRQELRQVFGESAVVRVKGFPVLVHGLTQAQIDVSDQQGAARTIISANPQWNGQVNIVRTAWTARARRDPAKPGSLVLVLATPGQANLVVRDGVLLENEYHNADIYSEECRVMRCFKCQKYHRTTSQRCRNEVRCGFCAGTHSTNDCIAKDSGKGAACVPCGRPGHPAWARDCPCRTTEVHRAREAYAVRPTRYQERPSYTPPATTGTGSTSGSDRDLYQQLSQFPFSARVESSVIPDERRPARKRGRPSNLERGARSSQSIVQHFPPTQEPIRCTVPPTVSSSDVGSSIW